MFYGKTAICRLHNDVEPGTSNAIVLQESVLAGILNDAIIQQYMLPSLKNCGLCVVAMCSSKASHCVSVTWTNAISSLQAQPRVKYYGAPVRYNNTDLQINEGRILMWFNE